MFNTVMLPLSLFLLGTILLKVSLGIKAKVANWDTIPATVSDIEAKTRFKKNLNRAHTYTVYVDYRYNGVDVNHVVYNAHNQGVKVGDKLNILVNPENCKEYCATDYKTPTVASYMLLTLSSLLAAISLLHTLL